MAMMKCQIVAIEFVRISIIISLFHDRKFAFAKLFLVIALRIDSVLYVFQVIQNIMSGFFHQKPKFQNNATYAICMKEVKFVENNINVVHWIM